MWKERNKERMLLHRSLHIIQWYVYVFIAPDIRIIDEARHELRDRYYKTGSGIELACVVRPSCPDSRVPYPVWRKNGETLPDHVDVYHINGWAYIAKWRWIERGFPGDGYTAESRFAFVYVYIYAHRILSTHGYISSLLSSRNVGHLPSKILP